MSRKFEYVSDRFSINNARQNQIPLPSRSTGGAAGYDFFSPIEALIGVDETVFIWTDIKASLGDGECLKIYARSSMALKRGLILKNSIGIVDSDYFENDSNDGNIAIALWNVSGSPQLINKGEKIAQGIFELFLKTSDDNQIDLRTGGFGSTGL